MITELTDLPEGVIGFEASGKLQAEDYRDVLLPAVERAAGAGGVRIVIVIPSFDGLSAEAMWEDLKMGVEPARLEAHRARHRRGVDAPDDLDVRLDDAGRRQALPAGRAGRRHRLGGCLTCHLRCGGARGTAAAGLGGIRGLDHQPG